MHDDDLDQARALHGALREAFAAHRGGTADAEAQRKVNLLCDAALRAMHDLETRVAIRSVQKYSLLLFSDDGHQEWAQGSMSGADFIRLKILNALALLRARLARLELKRASDEAGDDPAGTRRP